MVSGTDIKPAGRLDGLQVLRGVAALLVGWCHLKYNLGLTHEQLVRLPLVASDLGAIGVDIFFVISGFVIAMTAENTGGNGRAFFAHRIARIVPLYFTVSSYMLVLIVLWGVTTHEIDISQWLSFRLIFNTYAFIPIFDGPNFTSPACLNGWTLSFEMWFYVCFAALIKFCGGRLAGKLFPVVMAIGVATTALFYHSVLWYLPKFLFNPLVLEFSAGCLLYHGRHLMGDRMPLIMALAALAFLFFAIPAEFLGQNSIILADPKMAFYRTAVWGAFAVSLVGLVTQCDLKHHSAWPKFLLRLGDASYSIYLIAPLISLLLLITVQGTNKMLGYDFLSLTPFLSAIFYIMGTIFGGILLWKYFEVPATKKMKKLLSRFLPKPVPAIS